MKKYSPLETLILIVVLFSGTCVLAAIVFLTTSASKKPVPSMLSAAEAGRQKGLLDVGVDMVAYLGTESGTIVGFHSLPNTPTNLNFVVAEVRVEDGNRVNNRAVFILTPDQFRVGDMVKVQWIYHATPAGGHYTPFIAVAKN